MYIYVCVNKIFTKTYTNTKRKLQMKFRSDCILENPSPSPPVVTEYWSGLNPQKMTLVTVQ